MKNKIEIYRNYVTTKMLLFLIVALIPTAVTAGPPYDTDDPEPVGLHHWEFYVSSRPVHDDVGWTGTLPHFEANYGPIKNLQLHIIAPIAFTYPAEGTKTYGYGDTEIGIKFRFIQETKTTPMIGIFPLLEIPTGNKEKGLGNGKIQLALPVWLQKSFGKWQTYGGSAYWINTADDKKNWWYFGWHIHNQITEKLNIGIELNHSSPQSADGEHETKFNLGAIFDITENHHLLVSAGSGIQGSVKAQFYIGYQITIGAKE